MKLIILQDSRYSFDLNRLNLMDIFRIISFQKYYYNIKGSFSMDYDWNINMHHLY